jgi:hypothetical protein
MRHPIPTTIWAAVTAPFPYSVLYFTNTHADEGRGMRRWLAQFEEEHDVFDFSITQHLGRIAPGTQLTLHHGTADADAPVAWADEFDRLITIENDSRDEADRFDFRFYRYPGADHNLRPDWNTVVTRDLALFNQNFRADELIDESL